MTFNSWNGHVARPPATFAALMRGPSQLGAVGLAASANGGLLITSDIEIHLHSVTHRTND
jgi:hypothetical protein